MTRACRLWNHGRSFQYVSRALFSAESRPPASVPCIADTDLEVRPVPQRLHTMCHIHCLDAVMASKSDACCKCEPAWRSFSCPAQCLVTMMKDSVGLCKTINTEKSAQPHTFDENYLISMLRQVLSYLYSFQYLCIEILPPAFDIYIYIYTTACPVPI